MNQKILSSWITATGREKEWKPRQSSRICGNHFKKTAYQAGNGKGVLKETAIPTIRCHKLVVVCGFKSD